MKKQSITTEIINNVYSLYKKGVDRKTIATVLTMSRPSVDRIIKLMTTAERGDVEGLVNMWGDQYARMKQKVLKIYGITPPEKSSNNRRHGRPGNRDRNRDRRTTARTAYRRAV